MPTINKSCKSTGKAIGQHLIGRETSGEHRTKEVLLYWVREPGLVSYVPGDKKGRSCPFLLLLCPKRRE